MLFVMSLFVMAGMTLTSLAPIKQVAQATGEIRASSDVLLLESLRGGRVEEVFVSPDQWVAQGDPLVRLNGQGLQVELDRLVLRRAHLQLAIERLTALIEDTSFEPRTTAQLSAADLSVARTLFLSERTDLYSEAEEMDARAAQNRADLASLQRTRRSVLDAISAYEAKAQLSQDLSSRGLGRRAEALSEQVQVAEARTRLAELDGRLMVTREAGLQLEAESARAQASRDSAWLADRGAHANEIADIDLKISEIVDQLSHLTVTAPASGRILELGALTSGDVIEPGKLVARLLPSAPGQGIDVVAEVKILPKDIGHVAPDALAIVEVTTFDPDVFGEIRARLQTVSAASLVDAQGQPYFRGVLELEKVEASVGDRSLRLLPGMIVSARVITDQRRLIDYLLDPITRSLGVAFSER